MCKQTLTKTKNKTSVKCLKARKPKCRELKAFTILYISFIETASISVLLEITWLKTDVFCGYYPCNF